MFRVALAVAPVPRLLPVPTLGVTPVHYKVLVTLLTICAIGAVLAVSGEKLHCKTGSNGMTNVPQEMSRPVETRVEHTTGGAPLPVLVFVGATFFQILDGVGGHSVMLQNQERRPDNGEVYETPWYDFPTSYRVRKVRGRFPYDLLVVGEHGSGGGPTVLERWTVTPVTGSWAIDRPAQMTALGVGADPVVLPAVVAQGGTWIAPESRTGRPRERRALIDSSLDGAPVRTLAFDPDGRYAIYVGRNPAGLYQRVLTGDTMLAETLLHTPASIDDVGEIRVLLFRQHTTYGRVLVCFYGIHAPSRVTLLADTDNDGIFDPPLEISRALFDVQFAGSFVQEDFLEYDI